MKRIKRLIVAVAAILFVGLMLWGSQTFAQATADEPAGRPAAAAAADAAAPAATGQPTMTDGSAPKTDDKNPMAFMNIVLSSGVLGIMLWLSLLACSLAGVYLIIDAFVKINAKKIAQPDLVSRVREAMELGDLAKAMDHCKSEPGVMSNILMAGFSNVEEGFDVIQESISAVADLESEKLLQRVTYLSVVSNLAPMLGLMGTVQGMIWAFAGLATMQAGAAQQSMLAISIAQALYTTMAGLAVAIPAVAFYYVFRNRANNIILTMVITTTDLIKALRNVEVVEE